MAEETGISYEPWTPGGGSAMLAAVKGSGPKAVPVVSSRSKGAVCGYKSSNGKCKTKLTPAELERGLK